MLPKKIRLIEKGTGLRMKGFKIDLQKSSIYNRVVREKKTFQVDTGEIVKELLPRPIAHLIIKFTGYQKRPCILTPLNREGKIIGVLAVSSPLLASYFIPSVKNLAHHISSSLELADRHTKQQQTEEALRESELRYRALFKNAPIGIGVASIDGRVLAYNKTMLKMTGYSGAEIGRVDLKKDSYQDPKERKAVLGQLERKGFVRDFEARLKRKDGTPYCASLTITPLSLGGQKVLLTVATDITSRKQIERTKNEIISLTSHQLRTPLSTINWYTETILAEDIGSINKVQKRYLEKVYQTNKRLVKLVNALLNVSRIDLGTFVIAPVSIELKEMVESVLIEVWPQIKDKKLKVKKSYDKELPLVNVDPNLFRIILQNLLSNAIKYSPEKGKITIELAKDKENVFFKISDNGYGIPNGQQAKVFEKLFIGDNIKEKEPNGTGLGLYIVKAVVEQSGGKIWFESVKDKGTTFYVSFPLGGMKKKKGIRELALIH